VRRGEAARQTALQQPGGGQAVERYALCSREGLGSQSLRDDCQGGPVTQTGARDRACETAARRCPARSDRGSDRAAATHPQMAGLAGHLLRRSAGLQRAALPGRPS
jgi:hypothetical protein